MAGPYMQPGPRTNPPSFGYAPYGYGTAGECWPGYEYVGPYGYYADPYGYYAHPYAYYGDPYGYYAHPYGYGASGEDWTAYEYVNPYARYPSQGYYAPYASFDPRYYW